MWVAIGLPALLDRVAAAGPGLPHARLPAAAASRSRCCCSSWCPGSAQNVSGATRWIDLPGGLQIQPSEPAKLALVLWGADLLARKEKRLGETKHLLRPAGAGRAA